MEGNKIHICCSYPGETLGQVQRHVVTTVEEFERNMPTLKNFSSYLVMTRKTGIVAGMFAERGHVERGQALVALRVIFNADGERLAVNGEGPEFNKAVRVFDDPMGAGSTRLFPKMYGEKRTSKAIRSKKTQEKINVTTQLRKFEALHGVSWFYATDQDVREVSRETWKPPEIPSCMMPTFEYLEKYHVRVVIDGSEFFPKDLGKHPEIADYLFGVLRGRNSTSSWDTPERSDRPVSFLVAGQELDAEAFLSLPNSVPLALRHVQVGMFIHLSGLGPFATAEWE